MIANAVSRFVKIDVWNHARNLLTTEKLLMHSIDITSNVQPI